jgi:hypothetical protein
LAVEWNTKDQLSSVSSQTDVMPENYILHKHNVSQNPFFTAYAGLLCKIFLVIFPSPAGMSLTKVTLAGNNFIIPGKGEFG